MNTTVCTSPRRDRKMVAFPPDLHAALKRRAAEQDRTLAATVRQLLAETAR